MLTNKFIMHNIDRGIVLATGATLTFLSSGGLRKTSKTQSLDKCTSVNTNLGLSSMFVTGLLVLYRGIRM